MLYDTNNKSICSLEICPHFNSYDIWTVGLWVTFILYMFLCFSYMNRKEYIMALSPINLAPQFGRIFFRIYWRATACLLLYSGRVH